MKVRASYADAKAIVERHNGFTYNVNPDETKLASLAAEVLIEEKGYPFSTQVLIDVAWDEVDMTLTVEPNGSWELV